MDNGDGGKRFLDFVAIVDTFMPKEFKFSDAVKGIKGGLGVSLSKDVFAQIGSVGYALGDPLKSKIKIVEEVGPNFTRTSSTSEPPPMVFLLQATDDKAAERILIRLVPKMFAAAGNSVDPITRKVDGGYPGPEAGPRRGILLWPARRDDRDRPLRGRGGGVAQRRRKKSRVCSPSRRLPAGSRTSRIARPSCS